MRQVLGKASFNQNLGNCLTSCPTPFRSSFCLKEIHMAMFRYKQGKLLNQLKFV
jgi:predicted aldo/keto reductase-like oxidoreductase